ncbi:VOC family protein [Chryseolinea sp. H1M3-3]|uniref:VOC family protein n=1 Tax=Chryseolinea sp. H1M3-3 TaxID=3034144 RepID=UPI0023ED789D|nr:VOC family protein [Chryseolinea sp. H1M3-3]
MNVSQIHSTVPVISTDDIEKSLAYYQHVLGFAFDFQYGDPPVYAGVHSGNAEIYFTHSPALVKFLRDQSFHPDIFIWINDADYLFKLHVQNGAEVIEPLSNRPWGARQYVVRDINGYHLKFAQPI